MMSMRAKRTSTMIARISLVAAAALTGELLVGWSALAQPAVVQGPVPIGPHEPFVGFVNNASSNAIIRMACFGPIRPFQMGHPFSGQTVEVRLSPNLSGPGFTGNAHRIAAVASYPTPSATPAATVLATFQNYFVPAPISTALSLPCGGSGSVTFAPVNGGAMARPAVVGVSFVGQP